MLPKVCVIDDMYRPPVPLPHNIADVPPQISVSGVDDSDHTSPALPSPPLPPPPPAPRRVHHHHDDADETIPKRRSFSDEFLLSCRQTNTVRRLTDLDLLPPSHVTDTDPLPVSDVVVLNDERFPALAHLLRRLELDSLCRLYVAGCRLRLDAECQLLLARVSLRSLVLSYAALQQLPDCLFDMPALEVLKVDRNNLVEIPSLLGRLERLTSFCCASQRPRVRLLPGSITRLHQLQVLSISDNSIEAIDWIITLPNLRVLRCDRNRISHLPVQLVNLRHLTWLDVSHNPYRHIPYQLLELIAGTTLCRFDWFSVTLVPSWLRRQTTDQLCTYLALEAVLAADQPTLPATPHDELVVSDVTVAVFGDTGSGKRTLTRALADPRGVYRDATTRSSAPVDIVRFSSHVGVGATSGEPTTKSPLHRLRSDILRSNGILTDNTKTSPSPPASHRCNITAFAYLADYMDAYFRQLKTDVRLLLVDMTSLEVGQNGAAHAQTLARHVTRTHLWLDALQQLEPDSPVLLVGTHADLVRATSTFSDFVDELFPAESRRRHRRRYATTTAPCHDCLLCADNRKLNSSSSPTSAHIIKSRSSPGGHFDELATPRSHYALSPDTPDGATTTQGRGRHRTTTSTLPHVLGYVVVDSVRNYPKTDSKKANNASVERLRTVLQRVGHCRADRTAASWADFRRHITSLGATCGLAGTPCLPLEDVVCIARNYGIDSSQVAQVLRLMHQRCQVVHISDDSDPLLSSLVVVDCAWFMKTIVSATSEAARSQGAVVDASKLVRCLFTDNNYTDVTGGVQMGKLSSAHSLVVHWLLAAFQSLHVCIPFGISLCTGSRLFLFPDQLEVGVPNREVWPDRPDVDERQVTCDVGMWSRGGFRMFCDLLSSLCGDEGRRHLDVLLDPAPVLLAHDTVFFTAFDVDGCPDCRPSRRQRGARLNSSGGSDVTDDDSDAQSDDVLHKVRLSLNVTRMDAVRVQVRGPTPCCVLRALVHFIDLYLDDRLDHAPLAADCDIQVDKSSVLSTVVSSSEERHLIGPVSLSDGSVTGTESFHSDNIELDVSSEADTPRQLYFLCPKCVLLGETWPERISYRSMVDRRRKAVCSKWHNLGSWWRAVTGDYVYAGASSLGPDRPVVYSLTPSTLPDYEHPRLLLLLPPDPKIAERAWRMTGRAKFLEGHDIHVLCESPSAWHLLDGYGLRLPGPAPAEQSIRAQFNIRMLTVLDLSLTVVQLIQGVNEHSETVRLLAPVVMKLLATYDYLRPCDTSSSLSYVSRRDAELFLTSNKDRLTTMLTRTLTSAAQQAAGADNAQQADIYLKAGCALGPGDVFSRSPNARSSRNELARFLRLESSGGRFGGLRPVYIGGEVRWVCETHYVELRAMPSVQIQL